MSTQPNANQFCSNNSPPGGLSPLEILDQADDDERLLAALEGLTLESGPEDSSASSTFGDQNKQATAQSIE